MVFCIFYWQIPATRDLHNMFSNIWLMHRDSSGVFLFLCAEAVGNIISFLGMQPCERSDKVPENKNSHVLFLAGECLLLVVCFISHH